MIHSSRTFKFTTHDNCARARSDAGYSLIELFVAMAILAILMAIALPMFTPARDVVRLNEAVQAVQEYANAVNQYRADNSGVVPKICDIQFDRWPCGTADTPSPAGSQVDYTIPSSVVCEVAVNCRGERGPWNIQQKQYYLNESQVPDLARSGALRLSYRRPGGMSKSALGLTVTEATRVWVWYSTTGGASPRQFQFVIFIRKAPGLSPFVPRCRITNAESVESAAFTPHAPEPAGVRWLAAWGTVPSCH